MGIHGAQFFNFNNSALLIKKAVYNFLTVKSQHILF